MLAMIASMTHGHQLAGSAQLRLGVASRCASAMACAASTSAAGAIAGFWDEVVLAEQSRSSRKSTLIVKGCKDDALLMEYLTSCSELFGSETCSVTTAVSATAGSSAISLHVEPSAYAAPDAARAATEASGSAWPTHSRDSALELMMDWFTAQLMSCEIADIEPGDEDAIADDAAFVALGRSLLHTKSSLVSFAPTVQEMHRDLWRMVAEADYLQDGSGARPSPTLLAPTIHSPPACFVRPAGGSRNRPRFSQFGSPTHHHHRRRRPPVHLPWLRALLRLHGPSCPLRPHRTTASPMHTPTRAHVEWLPPPRHT